MGSLDFLMNANQVILSNMPQKSVIKGPLIKLCIFCGIFLPLTLWLGFWQLDRASEKTLIKDNQLVRSAADAIEFDRQRLENFARFSLRGEYESKSYLLDNRTRDGQVGYEVLTWFLLETGERLLVNRGWLKAGRYRTDIPEIASPQGVTRLNTYYYLSEHENPVLRHDAGYESDFWPRRIQSLNWRKLNADRNDPTVIGQFRLSDQQQEGAYLTSWPLLGMMPSKHMGYAMQWFALSATLVVLSVFACWRIVSDGRVRMPNSY